MTTATINTLNASDNSAMNGTYFRTSDVIPFVKKNQINMWNGRSYSASWGSSNVTSTATPLTNSVIKINVVGWHKHTVSPVGGNYFFVNENGKWTRRTANAKAVKLALGGK